mgnify:CR=1 FL=1
MIDDGKLLAIIAARGGSKRLPRKNVLDLHGKPMIAWSIQAGLQSKYVDRVVVTTDDEEIADVSRRYGASVPFMRPDDLSSDDATSLDVVRHAVKSLGESYKYIILLQPTSPLRESKHIDGAVEFLMQKNADGVIGVSEVEHPVEWTNVLSDDLSMNGFLSSDVVGKRSQDFPKRYRINGAIYLCDIEKMLYENTFFMEQGCYAYRMERESSIDVDEEVDFILAASFLGRKYGSV